MARHRNGKVTHGSAAHDLPRSGRLPKSLIENARLEEDRRAHDRNGTDRRQSGRAAVDANAKLGISLSDGVEGHLYSLSAQGCSIRLPNGSFKSGDAVWFGIESIQPLKGTVRWVDGSNVGVEFERPFYQALFELLAQSNKAVTVAKAA